MKAHEWLKGIRKILSCGPCEKLIFILLFTHPPTHALHSTERSIVQHTKGIMAIKLLALISIFFYAYEAKRHRFSVARRGKAAPRTARQKTVGLYGGGPKDMSPRLLREKAPPLAGLATGLFASDRGGPCGFSRPTPGRGSLPSLARGGPSPVSVAGLPALRSRSLGLLRWAARGGNYYNRPKLSLLSPKKVLPKKALK